MRVFLSPPLTTLLYGGPTEDSGSVAGSPFPGERVVLCEFPDENQATRSPKTAFVTLLALWTRGFGLFKHEPSCHHKKGDAVPAS